MDAFARQRPQDLPWARTVRFTENSVAQQVDRGHLGFDPRQVRGVTARRGSEAGTVTWYGLISDHDALGLVRAAPEGEGRAHRRRRGDRRARAQPGSVRRSEAVRDRSRVQRGQVPATARSVAERMVALVDGYQSTVQQNDGTLFTEIAPDCTRRENGVLVTSGPVGSPGLVKSPGLLAQGCEAQLRLGLYRPVDRVRARRVLAVDEERGLVVAASFADYGFARTTYGLADGRNVETSDRHPMARELFEVYRIEGGRIAAIEAVSVNQPYRMPQAW